MFLCSRDSGTLYFDASKTVEVDYIFALLHNTNVLKLDLHTGDRVQLAVGEAQ